MRGKTGTSQLNAEGQITSVILSEAKGRASVRLAWRAQQFLGMTAKKHYC
jgi:hypothetical protein